MHVTGPGKAAAPDKLPSPCPSQSPHASAPAPLTQPLQELSLFIQFGYD